MFFWQRNKAREMAEKEKIIQRYNKDTLDKIEEASRATKKTAKRMKDLGLDGITEAFMQAAGIGRKQK